MYGGFAFKKTQLGHRTQVEEDTRGVGPQGWRWRQCGNIEPTMDESLLNRAIRESTGVVLPIERVLMIAELHADEVKSKHSPDWAKDCSHFH